MESNGLSRLDKGAHDDIQDIIGAISANDLVRGNLTEPSNFLPELAAEGIRVEAEVFIGQGPKDILHFGGRWKRVFVTIQLDVFFPGVRLKARNVTGQGSDAGSDEVHALSSLFFGEIIGFIALKSRKNKLEEGGPIS
jgi:hypothetical protein